MENHIDTFRRQLKSIGKQDLKEVIPLPESGSSRSYYRFLFEDGTSLIGSYNSNTKENLAFYSFAQHFIKKNLPVPKILSKDELNEHFIIEDLGNETLMDILLRDGLTTTVKEYYFQAVSDLIRFQTEGIKGLDLSVAYPVSQFDIRSIMWDLNYFKYYFVKTNDITFDERLLEKDFENMANRLQQAGSSFFMFRDFQARNIMVKNHKLYYIDFQGGRQGPLQYDLISLLYQAKANLPDEFKKELLNRYLEIIESVLPGQTEQFLKSYPLFVYFRLMQVLGAYGFRGLFQRKAHFLQSIPFAIENLRKIIKQYPVIDFTELNAVFDQIAALENYKTTPFSKTKLNITLSSFSYKKSGIPSDLSENGGGFVFDCRALPNPGRIKELKDFTGLQKPVIDYLKQKKEMSRFLDNVFNLIDQSVDNYLERGFSNLMVSFGCTGGKHRSVYSAENLYSHLLQKYGDKIDVRLEHIQLKKDNLL